MHRTNTSIDSNAKCAKHLLLAKVLSSYHKNSFISEPVRILKAKKRLGAKEGDHITLINIFMRYNKIRGQKDKTKMCKENHLNEKSLIKAIRIYH